MTTETKRGFKKIKARYPYTCSGGCGNRYPQGTIAYWKREIDQEGISHSSLLCERCWQSKEG